MSRDELLFHVIKKNPDISSVLSTILDVRRLLSDVTAQIAMLMNTAERMEAKNPVTIHDESAWLYQPGRDCRRRPNHLRYLFTPLKTNPGEAVP